MGLVTSNTIRILMFQRLERIFAVAERTRHLARFVIYGSFVTDKIDPNDVDVFMVFDDDFVAIKKAIDKNLEVTAT